MRKIIPLIVLILLSALFTKAQNMNQADDKLASWLVASNKALIGISDDVLSNAKVFYTYEDKTTGIRYVSLQQQYKGIPVYNQILALSFRNDKLLSNFGSFDLSIEKTVNVASGVPSVTAESAVQSALSDRGFRASQMAIAINRKDQGRFVEFGNMGISSEKITAQLSWVPNELTKTYNLAWQVYIVPKTTSDFWMVRVNAVDNSILGMDNYTDYDNWGSPNQNAGMNYPAFDYGTQVSNATNTALNNFFDFKKADDPTVVTTASYRVVPLPAESPLHPGGAPALRTDPWLNAGVVANAVTLKWNTGAGATDYDYTRGNNVFAYHDRANDNTGSPADAATSTTALPNLTFDFAPDFTQEPTVTSPPNQQWNITNLFYWNNLIHDIFYGYGFTEAGKNFQDDNLGRGGAGADWVRAEAQDASGTNNANFSTPADGSLPRMQMYLWNAPTPDRDGDVDNGIIIHEYGHGISNRSNQGGTGCLGNSEQGGEGWSDYFSLMLTQNWATAVVGDGFNSPRGIGTYALNQPNNGPGIRPQRYCTDFAVNNTTYANLPGQAIPHGVGFVWCTALWEMTWELINDPSTTGITPNIYNFAGTGGNVVALRLVMEGLRTQQCNPGFISARNAIMRADTTLYGASHACAILRAFARRGMGLGAAEGSTSSITDQTVSFNGGGPAMAFTQNGQAGVPELQNIVYNHAITANCQAMTNFTLRDTLPLNANYVSSTNGGTYNAGNRVVSWPVNIAVGATQNYGLTVQVAAGSYFPPISLINEPVPSTTISGFWTTTSAPAGTPWIAHNVRSHSAPNSFFTPNLATASDQIIATTNSFAIGATPPVLSFWHWYNSEASWDGGVLEISTNGGGSWGDIGAANFTQNGYNGTLNTGSANPLTGRQAWNGNSAAFVETKVNMTPYANQANVKLRWRFGSDGSLAVTGWNVDDILMETRATVNLRSSLFNASNVRVIFSDTVTIILPATTASPSVTINQAAAQPDPTSVASIAFTAVFSEAVTGFATGDVVISGTAGATIGNVTGGPTTYTITVNNMVGSGTVIATIPAGVCINATNDPNLASTSTDNTVTYNVPAVPCVSTYSYTGPAVAIPDNTPAGVNIPITISGAGTITDLNFRFDTDPVGTCDATPGNVNAAADHTFIGDLIFTLTSPGGGTSVTLVNRRGGTRENICTTLLDDDGAFPALSTVTSTSGSTLSGNFAPDNPLSAFDGLNANGVWTLNVSDNALVDIGSMRRFSLIITSAAPTVNTVANQTVCAGSPTAAVNFTGTPAAATYTWTNSNTAIGLAASGTGNIPAFTATNATAAPIVGTITVTPTLGVCTGTPTTFTITVNPTPTVNAIPNQVLCQNLPTAPVNFTGTPAGVVFQWTNNTPAIGLAAAGTGNIPSFIAQNPGTTPLVATITVTPVTGLSAPVTTTFAFTGAVQTYTVPAGVTSINLKSWGAQGNSNAGGIVGGLGGYAEGNLAVTPGQILNVMVGGGATTTINGGYNGGGAAGVNAGCAAAQGGGGGGASDVRIAPYALANRVIVGAGGGGAGGNRTAGCGRGAGGGGGGGLYGGGGGAGWPGIPGSEGAVPTGGTQAAGGAGGVTTFTPGPTSGFPGALGVGGAGGTEVGSAQGTPTGPAEQGGIGGGLTGGSGLYNNANNWNGQSGAGGSSYIGGVTGGLTTAGLRSGNGQVQITYTPASATTCFGVARTFTITVNPNASLVIIADPGTTLCEGDPTLLTVYDAGAVTGPGTLYTQGTGVPANGSPSQVFEPVNAAFDSQGADDFTIPSGGNWNITQVTANGIGTGAPTSVNVFFYTNSSNLPGTAIASFTNITTFTRVGGNYTVTLPSTVNLGAGTYWMSFQVNMSFAAGGQWFWGNFGTTNVGNEYAWRNPGGGFATPCANWGYGATGCLVGGTNRNNMFSIIGTSVGLGPQSTGTFLWSPALGLSSTTSNPVAASPMNTTTYTVVRTTGQGCVASAQVTITVNKRPVVTAQPVNQVKCSGTIASFTVGATGTGLTYQWQESLTGCPGTTWTNVPNSAPYSGANAATLNITVSGLMSGRGYRCIVSGTCTPFIPPTNVSNCATLTVNPLPVVTITPAGPVCGGVAGLFGTQLSTASAPPPVPGSVTVSSGTINLAVPDGVAAGVSNIINMAGVPANATITNISVALNMPHTYPHDMIIGLKGPSGQVLSLYKHNTNTTVFPPASIPTAGWFNAIVNKTSSTAFSAVPDPFRYGVTAPTGPYKADALNGTTSTGYTIQDQTGFVSNALNFDALYTTAASMNNAWTLALCDGGAGDLGTLTSWSLTIDYTTPGTTTSTLSYVWSPITGLYTDAAASIPYTGTNTPVVYAAPTVLTTYTVTATDIITGCFSTASVLVNYTPPAPTVTPNPVTMCLGDAPVKLKSSSSSAATGTFCSGTVNVTIPDGPTIPPVPTSYPASTSNITVSGIPAGATITGVRARFNITHAYVGDCVMALKAPNGNIFNLDAMLNRTNNPGANFTNTIISSAGTNLLSAGTAPFTNTYKADAAGATFTAFGFTFPGGPVGYVPNVATYDALYNTGTVNGVWSIGIYDAGAPDAGVLNNWCLEIDYTVGVLATPAVWSPAAGLFSNAAGNIPYVAGTAVDSVWAMPTPSGVYNYQVTVQSIPAFLPVPPAFTNPAPITITNAGSTPYPSNLVVSGLPTTGVTVKDVILTGLSHTWSDDIDIVLQSPTGTNAILMSDVGGASIITNATYTFQDGSPLMGTGANPTGIYRPTNLVGTLGVEPDNFPAPGPGPVAQPTPTLASFTGNMNGTWKLFVVDDFAGDDGSISGGYTIRFNVPIAPCTSPARTVVVTVNQPTTLNAQLPAPQTICTDKVATFTVAVATGTGPHTYQWQVSTTGVGGPFTNIANGGVYSGATTATLTITAPPVSMNGYRYRCVVTGAAPCAAATSNSALLTVNPLPVIVISAAPYTSLLPGLRTTLSSTVTPNPAAPGGYSWIRNGTALGTSALGVVSGLGTGSIILDVDGQGDYQLRVTDVNGCTNISNTITIKDSASGRCYIYPNPTSGTFQVRYYSAAGNALPRTLTIYDSKGDRVYTKYYAIGRPYDRMDVDMRAYGKGLYWVEIGDLNGNRLTMCRVVIQ